MKAFDIVAYTYQAEMICPEHIVAALPKDVLSPTAHDMRAEDVLDQVAAYLGIDREDEHSYDSDEFPKVVFLDSLTEGDLCAHGWHPILND